MRARQKILASVFMALITVPMLAFPAVRGFIDTGNRENRRMTSFSEVIDAPYTDKPALFSEYYNDNLPFKNQIITLVSLMSMRFFRTTASPLVVMGEEGWLFFNNIGQDNPVSDVTGQTAFSAEELELVRENIARRAEDLRGRGIDFHILLIPNKEAIYKEYLPAYLRSRVAAESRTDMLASFLNSETQTVVYPGEVLARHASDYRLYYKYDSHWNELGAYLAARELFADMEIELPGLEQCELAPAAPSKDLAMLAGVSDFCNDDYAYQIKHFGTSVTVDTEYLLNGIVRYTSDAADKRTVLVIGDSYFEALKRCFYNQFADVIEVNRNIAEYDPNKLIKQHKPDIVVLQLVERASSVLLHEDILS